jgi:4-hydroxybenzoate polyprenyltransferase
MKASNKSLTFKFIGLFFSARGYNILIIILAQYLASIFILAPDSFTLKEILFDENLFIIVICSALVIASGYLINNFYDSEKDLINRPLKSYIDNKVSPRTKLFIYFVLNFLSVILASYISFRAVLFFSAYIFGIWIYSHKLKRITFIGNMIAASLAIAPFFAVFVYYKHFENVIFFHAVFLFLLILIREITKDLENLKGDFAQNYNTIPVKFGEKYTKTFLSFIFSLAFLTTLLLVYFFNLGYMNYYFYTCLGAFVFLVIYLWSSHKRLQFKILHLLLKILIIVGVFSILLIDTDLVLKKLIDF